MSNINRNNYEAFLLDYIEQNLSPDLVAELMLFLEKNPALKADLDEFENVTFEANISTTFNHKETLKQTAIEDLMIAEIEGLNTPEESNEIYTEIAQNSTYNQLYSNYKKTILIPAPIVFEGKKALKQKDTKVVPLYWWISSAAAILLVFFLLKNFNNDTIEHVSEAFQPKIVIQTQPLVSTPETIVNSSHSIIGSQQLANNKTQNTKLKIQNSNKEQGTSNHEKSVQTQQLETRNSTLETHKEMIEIEPYKEKEYITIEAFVENTVQSSTSSNDEYLSVGELLKKEAQKRILETDTKNAPTELVAANLVAKILGKNAEVETAQNDQGETEAYALNIGEFSFSRKIRK